MRRMLCAIVLIVVATARESAAQSRTERNVVYGMYSGLALLMDVHYPNTPNGFGVVFVAGSGWRTPLAYNAFHLKEAVGQFSLWGPPLLRAGYTVFAINHRAAPRFQYPAALEDVQRAVRFVRFNARRFGIDRNRVGGVGGSSGAHLIALAGLRASPGIRNDPDSVNRQAATFQAVVLRAGPMDLRLLNTNVGGAAVTAFLGRAFDGTPENQTLFAEASPIRHVSRSAPPALIVHGDADDTVPFEQAVAMEARLRGAGVPVKLIRVNRGTHAPTFTNNARPHRQLPQTMNEMVGWLDRYLKGPNATRSP
jgi:acetyl esterase/lipase